MNDRAASNTIGFILVFGLATSIIAFVSVTGFDVLGSVRQDEEVRNAERAFDVLKDNLDDVHREGAPSRATEISVENAHISTASTASINLSGWDSSGTLRFTANRTINPVVWQQRGSETRISYEFGAVIREEKQGGVVVNDPPLVLAKDKTILLVMTTSAREPASYTGGTLRIRGLRNTPRVITNGDGTIYNRLQIEITSARADIWQSYLERQPGTDCSLGPAPGERDRVTCDLAQRDELYIAIHPSIVEVEQ